MTDWGIGKYEHTATQLQPASEVLIKIAKPVRGEAVVDLGCGTGNASLLAAQSGATVVGVDPARRLLGVAGLRANDFGLQIEFVEGDAESIPLADDSADLITSVFGVIFAPDPNKAAAEMARVLAPNGRIVFSAWIPEGPLAQVVKAGRAAFGNNGPPPFAWHEQSALAELFAPHGLKPEVEPKTIAFTSASPEAYVEKEMKLHPMWVEGRAAMQNPAMESMLFDTAVGIFADANEEPMAFKTTSKYVVASLTTG